MDIILDSTTSGTISCKLTWSRENYIPVAVVVGYRVRIETTLFVDNASFTDNPVFQEQWSGEATETQKKTDGTKTDVYSRFSTDSTDAFYNTHDWAGSAGTSPDGDAVKSFKQIENKTFTYDTNDQQVSASAFVLDVSTWKPSGELSLAARLVSGALPGVRYQAGDRAVEVQKKDDNKSLTCIVVGNSRLLEIEKHSSIGALFGSSEFVPFTVTTDSQYKRYKVISSYRQIPSGTATDIDVANINFRNDSAEAQEFGQNEVENNTVPDIRGSITMAGYRKFTIGDLIDKIVTTDGDVNVGLAVIDVNYQPEQPRQGGEPAGDTTTIELGRV